MFKVQSQVPERRVQGDIFHMMKRPRPAAKHSYLHLYAEALSFAFFIRNAKDEYKVRRALMQRDFYPKDIEKILLNDHEYTRRRVRRTIRPVSELAPWLGAILKEFGPLRCSNTKVLLNKEAGDGQSGKGCIGREVSEILYKLILVLSIVLR